jgi:hypothetical protein
MDGKSVVERVVVILRFVMPLFEYFNLTFLGVSHRQPLSFLLD